MNLLAATCKAINNANRAGKRQVLINKTSKSVIDFLLFMQSQGYLNKITFIDDHKQGKVCIDLNGRLVKCGAICPRFNAKVKNIERWRSSILPARQFGHVVFSTSNGIMSQNECLSKKHGGFLLGYFY
ncbi:hypothetical protein EDEG_01369 [Edhazardia aedis USNM 41457]|uniref:30S ribosomal protein S8 n=1 Tax=Edhazardia aedis (strain USNM 41457) TaxID=1003232 RepID=J9DA49_EDHAE|nr:hypothetical protein EDEG_01369 [Edhazardia aedis USNM 41457]|eukprot:EJW04389.1 hypothetical protein EDEG_01369 [Edhazardia aedis USNM 41457]